MLQTAGWLSAHYEILKDFQGILGNSLGFIGVIVTFLYNSKKERNFYLRHLTHGEIRPKSSMAFKALEVTISLWVTCLFYFWKQKQDRRSVAAAFKAELEAMIYPLA